MKKINTALLALAMAAFSTSSGAWWGGPFSSWADDFFGDGWFSFSFSMGGGAHGRGDGRYYDHYAPYGYPYGGAYTPAYGYPEATPEQQAEAQRQLQQAVEAQRRLAEQMARQPGLNSGKGSFEQMTQESDARYEQAGAESQSQRDVMDKRAEQRRLEREQRRVQFATSTKGSGEKSI